MPTITATALAAWLITYALQSTVVLGAAWATVRWLKPDHATRDIIWKAALVGGVVTATLQGAFAWRPQGSLTLPLASSISAAVPESATVLGAEGFDELPISRPDAPSPVSVGAGDVPPNEVLDGTPASPRWSIALLAWLWAALALPFVIVYAARRLILTGRLGDRRPVTDATMLAHLDALRASGEVAAPVRLTSSAAISSPVALGASEICLPSAALAELEPEQLRAMLAHELAHLVRRDPFWLVLACVIERALFFQPLNRLARAELLQSAEYLADEWAARRAGGIPLAKALVKVAEWIQASPLGVPVAGFAEERSQLSVRVSRLLDRAAWGAPKSRWGIGMLAAAVVLVMTAFAPGVSFEASAARDEGRDLPPVESSAVQVSDSTLVPALIARLRDEDAEVRRATADALGRLQDRRAITPLVAALADEDDEVRTAALHALSNFEQGVPAAPIRRLLDADDAETRSTALRMLGQLRDRSSIPAITQRALDADEEVRWAALEALEEMDAPIGEELVARVIEDRSAELRQLGLRIAGDRQMVSLVAQMIAKLEDPSADVREQAAQSLTELKTEASHRALRAAITHRDPRVRRIAVSYLGDEGDR